MQLRKRWFYLTFLILLILSFLLFRIFFGNQPVHPTRSFGSVRNRLTQRTWALPAPHVYKANCQAIFNGNPGAVRQGLNVKYRDPINAVSDDDFLSYHRLDHDCLGYLSQRQFIIDSQSAEEDSFSIAFSIVIYHNVAQFERLLRAIYRPQNYYCIHVDAKSSQSFYKAIESIAMCLGDNIFLAQNRQSVQWGRFSVLEADLACFRELIRYPNWRYLINLTGEEFPLRTNLELVRILRIFNGTNSIEGTKQRRNELRVPRVPLSFQLTWYKGSVHITASRAFISFALTNSYSRKILSVLHLVSMPDEQFFATLNHNPTLGTPGAYLGTPESDPDTYPFITRLKNWQMYPFNYPCRSRYSVRQVCIWGVRDLSFIGNRPELFVNKFYDKFQPIAFDCMEERYFNRTLADYQRHHHGNGLPLPPSFDYYRRLSFVRHHQ